VASTDARAGRARAPRRWALLGGAAGVGLLFVAACARPNGRAAPSPAPLPAMSPAPRATAHEAVGTERRGLVALLATWRGIAPEDAESRRAFCSELTRTALERFADCTLESLGQGAALLVRQVDGCGGDSCGTRGWLRTRALTDFRELPIDVGGTVEASVDGTALFYDAVTSVALPGGDGRDPLGGTEPVVTMRLSLPSLETTPFAACFSPRLSPSGQWLLCRDRAANVLRVPVAGGTPQRWVRSGRRPDEIEFVPHAYLWPDAVDFPSPTTLAYSIPLQARALGNPTGLEQHSVPWSDGPLAELWEVRFDDHYPDPLAFSLRAWSREHGLAGPSAEQRCWDLGEHVGVPAAPGLLCLTVTPQPLTHAHVYRQEGARLRQVFEAIIAAWANWLELTPLLEADGSLRLIDRSPGDCRAALAEASAKAQAHVAPPAAEYLPAACARVGLYRYERGQYRRDSTAKPGTVGVVTGDLLDVGPSAVDGGPPDSRSPEW
jgi:hypothetical protein